ncbi:MAG: helix-turn-helix domain-containing protein [Bdellovibrionales bacterium]|nr:helix-turn-helix domain-containing protein [Bdellovibrionales bacterium]
MNLDQIGQILNQEREHHGLTLKQISSATCISCTQLEAIEKGDHSKLPAKPYVRGFIQAYCKVLNIDSTPLLEIFGTTHTDERAKLKETRDLDKDFERLFTLGHVSLLLLIMVFSGLIIWMRSHLDQFEVDARKLQSISTSDILHQLESQSIPQEIIETSLNNGVVSEVEIDESEAQQSDNQEKALEN